jgi:hypothetical protein
MKKKILFCSVILITIISITACGGKTPAGPTTGTEGSPVSINEAYPAANNAGYPAPVTATEGKQGPVFTINKPVKVSATEVTGTGPAKVPIVLVSVTNLGEQISSTVISNDGTFVFKLTAPLTVDTTVGIMLGDLSGTSFNAMDFTVSATYYDRPMIGILFDIAQVVQ